MHHPGNLDDKDHDDDEDDEEDEDDIATAR
jgi:hypothetical protein